MNGSGMLWGMMMGATSTLGARLMASASTPCSSISAATLRREIMPTKLPCEREGRVGEWIGGKRACVQVRRACSPLTRSRQLVALVLLGAGTLSAVTAARATTAVLPALCAAPSQPMQQPLSPPSTPTPPCCPGRWGLAAAW